MRLIRYFGFYSSKSRGKWHDWEHVARHAPDGWRIQNGLEKQEEDDDENDDICCVDDVSHKKSKASWARLIQKIYEIDIMTCPKCASKMRIIAIITNEYEIKKIMRHLLKSGKSPPGAPESV